MRLKYFQDHINEVNRVINGVSRTGKSKSIDVIWDDPTNDKSLSSGILLKKKLKDEELKDLINILSDDRFSPKSKDKIKKISTKSNKLAVAINNLQFLKDKQEEGELKCEYCDKGPLIIYDFKVKMDKKMDPSIRFNRTFNPRNGATCDHKIPQSKGGDKFNYDNLAVCCYYCNQRKKNMDYNEWTKLISSEYPIKEASKFLSTKRTIEDLFLSISEKYKIEEVDKNEWLSYYDSYINNRGQRVNRHMLSHFVVTTYDTSPLRGSWRIRVYLKNDESRPNFWRNDEFENDFDKFRTRLEKYGFETENIGDSYVEKFTNGYIYEFLIIGEYDRIDESLDSKNPTEIEKLMKVDKEDIEDILLEITDKYDITFYPSLFWFDEISRKIIDYNSHIPLDLMHSASNQFEGNEEGIEILPGYLLNFSLVKGDSSRNNRLVDKKFIKIIHDSINQKRLEKLNLSSQTILTVGTEYPNESNRRAHYVQINNDVRNLYDKLGINSINNDIWSIAIFSHN